MKHPDPPAPTGPPPPDFEAFLDRGIDLFNRRLFFEAHEAWEDAWRAESGDRALFLQGLIQVAAAFVKLQRGAPSGMVALLDKGWEKLERLDPADQPVDLVLLENDVARWRAEGVRLLEAGGGDWDAAALPRLRRRQGGGGARPSPAATRH